MWPFSGGVSFTANDIPSLAGKVILVTGGNSGLGKQTVLDLARHGPREIWLTARTTAQADEAIRDIQQQVPAANIRPLAMDLSSFASVTAAARAFTAAQKRLDILVLNAGCMFAPAALTADGYELQFGTNHLGHALLVRLLAPTLDATAAPTGADVRVVVLSSGAVATAPRNGGILFASLKTPQTHLSTAARYGQSKLANALYARALADAKRAWTVAAVHPGVVNTNLARHVRDWVPGWAARLMTAAGGLLLTTVEAGARNQLWAAAGPRDAIVSGALYYPVGDLGGWRGPYAADEALATRLWEWTEEELKGHSL